MDVVRNALALLALAGAAPAFADVSFHVASVAPDRTVQMDVTLAGSYMAVDYPQARLIYDFNTRRRYAIDKARKVYVEYSLFDVAGFRVMEMSNRERLYAALAAVKGAEVQPVRTVQIENELSILKNGRAVSEDKAAGDGREFFADGLRLAAWSDAATPLSAGDARQFGRFMRYAEGGHPQFLDKLVQLAAIPGRVTLFLGNSARPRTTEVTFSDVRSVAPAPYDLTAYTREVGNGLDGQLDRIAAMSPQQLAALRDSHPCDQGGDFSPAQELDTMLGKLECSLSTGVQMEVTDEVKQAIQNSPSLSLLFAAVSAKKESEYADAVKTLVALREKAPRKAYVLKVFEANHRMRLRQPKEARQLFVDALEANPVLGGAYKDLGDLLLTQYDSPRAWRCWDIGRRVSPNLSNFAPVNKFEADLLAQHPEFF